MPGNLEDAFRKAGYVPQPNNPTTASAPMRGPFGRPPMPDPPRPPVQKVESLDEDYVDRAEGIIVDCRKTIDKFHLFTTSKIRNILSMVTDIFNDVSLSSEPNLDKEMQDRIRYMKVRLVYECGRERIVKQFVEKAALLEIINGIGSNKQMFLRFSKYMEALVAYHRYYGGSD